jgi:hypothetical protein
MHQDRVIRYKLVVREFDLEILKQNTDMFSYRKKFTVLVVVAVEIVQPIVGILLG